MTRLLATAALVMGLWIGGLALVTCFLEPTATVLVFGSQARVAGAAVAAGVDLLDVGFASGLLRSQRKGFVRDLYAKGALLVLPAPAGGCLGLSPPRQAGRTKKQADAFHSEATV